MQDRYNNGMLLFDVKGRPDTIDLCVGGDHGQGNFSYTASVANQILPQARHNQILLMKGDQKDSYNDICEMVGGVGPILVDIEAGGIQIWDGLAQRTIAIRTVPVGDLELFRGQSVHQGNSCKDFCWRCPLFFGRNSGH